MKINVSFADRHMNTTCVYLILTFHITQLL